MIVPILAVKNPIQNPCTILQKNKRPKAGTIDIPPITKAIISTKITEFLIYEVEFTFLRNIERGDH